MALRVPRNRTGASGAATAVPSPLARLGSSPIFETLHIRDFRWLWFGSFASFLAMNMQMLTRSWLVLRLEDDSPLALSLVMVSFAAPMTLVSMVGGALADRIPRKQMVILSQGGNAVMTLVIATLDWTGLIQFWHVLAIGVVNGSLMALNMPSRQAIISDIVPEDKLMNAVALNNSGMNLTRVLGPVVAGILIVFLDTGGVFYLIAGIYVLAVLSMGMINAGSQSASKSGKSMVRDIKEGFSYAVSSPTILGLVIMAFIPSLFGFSLLALLPAWAREEMDVQSADFGVLMMFMGMGALVGTLGLASIKSFSRRGMLLLANSVLWGLALAAFAQTSSFALAIPLLLAIGLLSSIYMSLNMTLMQLYSVPEMRGRVMSIGMMTFGLMPLGSVPFGALAEHIGTGNALSLSGLLLAGVTVLFALSYRHFRKIA